VKGVGSLIVILVVLGIAVSSSNNSSGSGNSAVTQSQPKPQTWASVLDAHYSRSVKLCNYYDTLVNQGWNDDEIYGNLSDAGTFDSFYGQGRDFFNAMVKWCYKNNY
jgi:hypothetical protein